MTATISIDKAGRMVLPKAIRDHLNLRAGSRMHAEITGDRIELTPEPTATRIERRGKRRVITGWDGFDAAKAVREAREDRERHLAGEG